MIDRFLKITNDMVEEQDNMISKALKEKEYSRVAEYTAFRNGLTQAIANYEVTREKKEGCGYDGFRE